MRRIILSILFALAIIFRATSIESQNLVTIYNNPAFVQATSTTANSSYSVSVTFNTAPAVGNVGVCAFSLLAGADAGPAGWTRYKRISNFGIALTVYYHAFSSSDTSGPYTFTSTVHTTLHLGCAEFTNVDPINTISTSQVAIGTLAVPGAVSVGTVRSTISGSLPVFFSAATHAASASQAGWTNTWDLSAPNSLLSGHGQYYDANVNNGATWVANTLYASTPGTYVAEQVVLRPKLPPNSLVGPVTSNPVQIPVRAPIVAYVGGQYAWLPDPSITQANVDYPMMEPFSHELPPYFGNIQCPVGSACSPWAYLDSNTMNCTNDEIDWYNLANNGSHEDWFLHTTTPITPFNRVTVIAGTTKCLGPDGNPNHVYYANLLTPGARAAYVSRYSNRIATPTGLSPVNQAIMADNNSPYCNKGIIYEYGCPSSPTSTVSAITTQRQAEADMIADFAPSKVMCNGLGPGGGFYGEGTGDNISTTSLGGAWHYAIIWQPLYTPSNLLGCIHEGTLRRSSEGEGGGEVNARIVINDSSQILNQSNQTVTLLDYPMNTDCTSNDQLRREHQALKMIIAGPYINRVLDWEASYVPTTACIASFPEQDLYFKNPLRQMRAWSYNSSGNPTPELPFSNGSGCMNTTPSGSHTPDLRSSGGVEDVTVDCPSGPNGSFIGTDTGGNPAAVWAREYNDCYYQGVRFGHCAAIFNATDKPVTIPAIGSSSSWTAYNYTHAIGWTGSVLPWACPANLGCNGAINLTSSSVVMGTTQVPGSDAMLLAP